jgi:hypothetical protein
MAKKRPAQKRGGPPTVAVKQTQDVKSLLFRIFITGLLLLVYGFYLAHQVDLTAGDLGRHLKNGQLFFENGLIPKTNLYSYTYPDYPFINHHWGSGVLFYGIQRLVGFFGLSLAFIVMSLITLLAFFNLATKYSSFALAAPIAVIVFPVLITRHEVRPELFSYFFCGVFLQILWGYKHGKLGSRWLFLLPILEVFWVNLHIYFFIGVMLIGVYLFELLVILLTRKKQQNTLDQAKGLAVILLLTVLATCLSPAGISGAIYPFLILNEYGAPVIENYSIGAILQEGYEFLPLIYFGIVFGLVCVSWLYAVTRNRSGLSLGNFLLSVFFFTLAWSAIRNFALAAYFALPIAAVNLKSLLGEPGKPSSSPSMLKVSAVLAVIPLVLVIIKPAYFVSSNRGPIGLGLETTNDAAADFFLRENMQGPIFNNFDVGTYLIYHLYPGQRVFIDNRPEAYPVSFFQDVYIPVQLDEAKWKSLSNKYGFNVILFNHHDRSVWGEQFIIRRLFILCGPRSISIKILLLLQKEMAPINRSSQDMNCRRKVCWSDRTDLGRFWVLQPCLHELWDTGLLETEKGSAKALVARLDQEFNAEERKSWEAGTPKDWANESLAVTIEYVYPLLAQDR